MADFTLSPNMSLPLPIVGQDPGPDYASNQNAAFSILDAHDHSSGNGVNITPSGLNINAALAFNGNNITTLVKLGMTSQSAALTGTNFLSTVGGNMYFNDGSGNQIPITSGGGVAGTPGSIGSLASPASATYSAGSKLFTWSADSGKAAAMDNGAVTIRETNVAAALGVTLQSAASLAADYSLTLPAALPVSTQYLTSTSGGVLSFSTANQIGSAITSSATADSIGSLMTSTGANAIQVATTRSTGTSVGTGGVAISGNSGVFSTASASFVDVTNLSVSITTSGRPVELKLIQAISSSGLVRNTTGTSTFSTLSIQFLRDGVAIALFFAKSGMLSGATGADFELPPSAFAFLDTPAAGTYTYKVQARLIGGGTLMDVINCALVAYEI